MANSIVTTLLFNLDSNIASLTQGLQQANQKFDAFGKGVSQIKNVIAGAFTVTAIIGFGKEVFELSQKFGELAAGVNDITGAVGKDLQVITGNIKAVSDQFGTDFNETLKTSNAIAHQFGISQVEASELITKGLTLNDENAQEFLATVKEFSPRFQELGLTASESIGLIGNSFDAGIGTKGVQAIAKASQNLREMNKNAIDALASIGINGIILQNEIVTGSKTQYQAIQEISAAMNRFGDTSVQVGDVIKNVFGKTGVAAGSEFIKSLATMDNSLESIVANTSESTKANLELVEASSHLNQVWVSLFENSSTNWTKIKATLTEITATSLKALIDGTVKFVNGLITAYNNSIIFRAAVQQFVLYWKLLFDGAKLFFNLIYDGFTSAGKLITAALAGDFDQIPDLLKEAYANAKGDFVSYGSDAYKDFKTSIESTMNNSPIQLINFNDVQSQATKAANIVKQTMSDGVSLTPQVYKEETPYKPITGKDVDIATSKGQGKIVDLQPFIKQTKEAQSVWSNFGDTLSTVIQQQIVVGINLVETAIGNLVTGTKSGFKDLIVSMLGGIKQLINALLAQAIAAMIAGQAIKGLPGLIIAAVGVTAIEAMFKKLPAFAMGTDYAQGGLSLIGESGPELLNIPRGASVFTNSNTNKLLNAGQGSRDRLIIPDVVLKGNDLYLSFKETERKRGNSN